MEKPKKPVLLFFVQKWHYSMTRSHIDVLMSNRQETWWVQRHSESMSWPQSSAPQRGKRLWMTRPPLSSSLHHGASRPGLDSQLSPVLLVWLSKSFCPPFLHLSSGDSNVHLCTGSRDTLKLSPGGHKRAKAAILPQQFWYGRLSQRLWWHFPKASWPRLLQITFAYKFSVSHSK